MIKVIKTCDKCGKEVVNPQEITISSVNYISKTIQLCPEHYEVFLSVIMPIKKSAHAPADTLYDYLSEIIHDIASDIITDKGY